MMVHIRSAGFDDLEVIAGILVKSWQAAYRGIVPGTYLDALTPCARERRMRRQWEAGRKFPAYLLFVDGTAAGTLSLRPPGGKDSPDGWGEIGACYLLPAYWGKGLGARLLEFSQRELFSMGAHTACLWVLRDNARARRAYERAGFAFDGMQKLAAIGGAELTELRYYKLLPVAE